MKKLIIGLGTAASLVLGWLVYLNIEPALAQCNGVFPPNTLCGNLSAASRPPGAFSATTSVIGPGSSTVSDFAVWANTTGNQLADQPPDLAYSVKRYNAKGDGVTDDTVAIQAAFTAAGTGTVFFPCGTYIVTSTINTGFSSVAGAGLCAMLKTTNNIPILTVSANTAAARYSGIHFVGSSTGNSAQVGILVGSGVTNFIHNVINNIYCENVTTCFESSMAGATAQDWNSFTAINMIGVKNGFVFDNFSGTGNVFGSMNIVGASGGANIGGYGFNWFNGGSSANTIGDIAISNIELGGGLLSCFNFAPSTYGSNIVITNWQCDGGPTNYLSTSTVYHIKIDGFNLGGAVSTKTTSGTQQVTQDLNSFERRYGKNASGTFTTATSLFDLKLPVNQTTQANGVMVEIVGTGSVGNRGAQVRTQRFSVLNQASCVNSVSTLDTFTDGVSPYFSYTTTFTSIPACVTTFYASMPAGATGLSTLVFGIRIVGDTFDVVIQ